MIGLDCLTPEGFRWSWLGTGKWWALRVEGTFSPQWMCSQEFFESTRADIVALTLGEAVERMRETVASYNPRMDKDAEVPEEHVRQLIVNLDAREWLELFPYDWMSEKEKRVRATVVVQSGLAALRIERQERMREALDTPVEAPTSSAQACTVEDCTVKWIVTLEGSEGIWERKFDKGDFVLYEGGCWVSIHMGEPERDYYTLATFPADKVLGVEMHQNECHGGPPRGS